MSEKPKLQFTLQAKLTLSLALCQSLEILQMPQLTLRDWLQEQIEKNPILELPLLSAKEEFFECAQPLSLNEKLNRQIHETFEYESDQNLAKQLIGYLDERGFLSTPLEEISLFLRAALADLERIIKILKTFDPPGIAAQNLQEALLLQIERQNQQKSLLYRIVKHHFDDLIHQRFALLQKKTSSSPDEISLALQKLARLHLRPSFESHLENLKPILPDLRATQIDQAWIIEVIEDEFPPIQIRSDYLSLLPLLASQEKKTLKEWCNSAKWLKKALNRRRNLLHKIAASLLEKPKTIDELAFLLNVHESTIHRALCEKWIEGPWGIKPLKSFILSKKETETSKETLKKLIEHEDKQKPLTDEELSHLLKKSGLDLARRTITKYRKELKIGSASQRKLIRH